MNFWPQSSHPSGVAETREGMSFGRPWASTQTCDSSPTWFGMGAGAQVGQTLPPPTPRYLQGLFGHSGTSLASAQVVPMSPGTAPWWAFFSAWAADPRADIYFLY